MNDVNVFIDYTFPSGSDDFNFLKKRYQTVEEFHNHPRVKESDTIVLDFNIAPILNKWNQLDGVTTIYSCEGHFEKREDSDFYIMFAVTPDGLQNIFEVYAELVKHFKNQIIDPSLLKPNLLRLSFSQRLVHLRKSAVDWRPVVLIGYKYANIMVKEIFIKAFNDVLDAALKHATTVGEKT